VLSIVGIYLGGLVGAASGVLAATLIGLAMSVTLGVRAHRIIIPYWHFARIAIATLGMVAALAMFPVTGDWRLLVIKIMGGAAIYFVLLSILYGNWLVDRVRHRFEDGNVSRIAAKPGGKLQIAELNGKSINPTVSFWRMADIRSRNGRC